MTPLRFCFDPLSPYAWLAFEALPEALAGLSHSVEYRPILWTPPLTYWSQLGPAHWLWACADEGYTPNRWACEIVLRQLWVLDDFGGAVAADDPVVVQRLCEPLHGQLQVQVRRDPAGESVRQQLHRETEVAIERGLLRVPMIEVLGHGPLAGRRFWGQDGLTLLAAYLRGDTS